mmetsp:Transcript_52290/g.146007  ORF Transcript_52290/g.146007 Transcript_52290/m.146007 type:complete len:445 (-) Transcript_52290:446-1780(-)
MFAGAVALRPHGAGRVRSSSMSSSACRWLGVAAGRTDGAPRRRPPLPHHPAGPGPPQPVSCAGTVPLARAEARDGARCAPPLAPLVATSSPPAAARHASSRRRSARHGLERHSPCCWSTCCRKDTSCCCMGHSLARQDATQLRAAPLVPRTASRPFSSKTSPVAGSLGARRLASRSSAVANGPSSSPKAARDSRMRHSDWAGTEPTCGSIVCSSMAQSFNASGGAPGPASSPARSRPNALESAISTEDASSSLNARQQARQRGSSAVTTVRATALASLSLVAAAHRMLARCCGSRSMAGSSLEACSRRAGRWKPRVARPHSVFETSCGLNVHSVLSATSPRARMRPWSLTPAVAKAQMVLETSRPSVCPAFLPHISAATALKSTGCLTRHVAKDHTTVTRVRICTLGSRPPRCAAAAQKREPVASLAAVPAPSFAKAHSIEESS